jgi:hypothetical protein
MFAICLYVPADATCSGGLVLPAPRAEEACALHTIQIIDHAAQYDNQHDLIKLFVYRSALII